MESRETTEASRTLSEPLAQRARKTLVITQAIFFTTLAWCVLLVHNHDAQNSGISYYGVHLRTVAFAIFAYASAAVGLWRASTLFQRAGLDSMSWVGMRVIAVVLIVLLLTPYSAGAFLNWAHMTTGVIGALVQLAMVITLLRRRATAAAVVGFTVQLVGGILGALSLPNWGFTYLLTSEIIFQIGFCWCLLEWTSLMPRDVAA